MTEDMKEGYTICASNGIKEIILSYENDFPHCFRHPFRVEVTRADGYRDEPIEADMTDWDGNYYTLRDDRSPRYNEPSLICITDIYRQVWGRETGSDEDGIILYSKPDFKSENVKHIRLTVLETVKGMKYSDLCISELVLLDGFKD